MWESLAERVVAEHEALVLPDLTPREVTLPLIPGKADAIIGMRRSGKTWRVLQHLRELEDTRVPRSHALRAFEQAQHSQVLQRPAESGRGRGQGRPA